MDTTPAASDRLRSPGVPDDSGPAAAFAALFEPALTEAAARGGRRVAPLSVALDIAYPLLSGELAVESWVERATRTLVFVSAEARTADGRLAAAASAIFRADLAPG